MGTNPNANAAASMGTNPNANAVANMGANPNAVAARNTTIRVIAVAGTVFGKKTVCHSPFLVAHGMAVE